MVQSTSAVIHSTCNYNRKILFATLFLWYLWVVYFVWSFYS